MKKIKIQTQVKSDIDKVWEYWNEPEHIRRWAFASDEWECPYAENDSRTGGKFVTRMASKDGSSSFDILGVYTSVVPKEKIEYTMDDGRSVSTEFIEKDGGVYVVQEFEMESENSDESQRSGWQAILDNFKKHVEEE